jgi:hypothetical protein
MAQGFSTVTLTIIAKTAYNQMQWIVEFLDEEVRAALDAFPFDIRAGFQRIVELIQMQGLDRVREP